MLHARLCQLNDSTTTHTLTSIPTLWPSPTPTPHPAVFTIPCSLLQFLALELAQALAIRLHLARIRTRTRTRSLAGPSLHLSTRGGDENRCSSRVVALPEFDVM